MVAARYTGPAARSNAPNGLRASGMRVGGMGARGRPVAPSQTARRPVVNKTFS